MTKKYTNKLQQMVAEFQGTFGHPSPEEPTVVELDRAIGRSSWGTGEEIVEYLHASSTNEEEFKNAFIQLLQGLRKAYDKQSDKEFPKNDEERLIAQGDAVVDLLVFTLGNGVENGLDLEPIFEIVHNANMSKLFTNEETGEKYVKYNDEGKIMKSPEFEPPEDKIKKEILSQIKKSKTPKKGKVKPEEKVVKTFTSGVKDKVLEDPKDVKIKMSSTYGEFGDSESLELIKGEVGKEIIK